MIKQEVIEQVRMQTDIVQLIGGYVPLKKAGRYYKGLCPFHSERTPSFHVNQERQTYHCFGCGTGGTAINFVMVTEKLEFPEAVKFLAKKLGITVETEQVSGRNQGLYDICDQVCLFFEQQLPRTPAAMAYVEKRGLSAETVRRFRLGFAPAGNMLRGQAKRRNWSEDLLVRAGLLNKRDDGLIDWFHGRLMFPIFSLSGKVIAFSGRVLDDSEPKYLNSPETVLFRKGDNLYGVFQAKGYIREQIPILVEGNLDMLSLVDAGINNVVAPLGTALTPVQAQLLRRYNTRVTVCFDGDNAGRKACRRGIEILLGAGLEPQIALLPDGSDPDSYVRQFGKEKLLELLAKWQDWVEFVLAGRDLARVAEQRAALTELVGLLRLIGDDTTRELYANRIADRFRVDKVTLLRSAGQQKPGAPRTGATRGIEEKLLGSAIQSQELARIARDLGLAEILVDEKLRPIARLAVDHCDDLGFNAGLVLGLIEDKDTRELVSAWTFDDVPTPVEFREALRRFRAKWLDRRLKEAHARGEDSSVEELQKERSELLQEVTRERSSRHEE
ncbi:MAG: DNA primase [candidate division WOR-3 bacterium]|nr:DNA primase [candidate division WOR-3 bacterium]